MDKPVMAAYSPTHNTILTVLDGSTSPATEQHRLTFLRQHYPDLIVADADVAIRQIEDAYCTDPEVITEKQYQDALDVVPPMRRAGTTFLMGELVTGSVGTWYTCLGQCFMRMRQRYNMPLHEVWQRFAQAEVDARAARQEQERQALIQLGTPEPDEVCMAIDRAVKVRARAA